jgi:hypothetical protein
MKRQRVPALAWVIDPAYLNTFEKPPSRTRRAKDLE